MANNYTPYGINLIYGPPDSGKTDAALFSNYMHGIPLKKIVFFDNEGKDLSLNTNDLGLFIDLKKETKGMKLFEYREFVLDRIAEIQLNQFSCIIFDTWSKFGESLRNYVIANKYEFREEKAFVMTHLIKVIGAQAYRDSYDYESQMATYLKNLTGCLIITSHQKEEFKGKGKTGRMLADLNPQTWEKVCNLRLKLIRRPEGVPAALVLKRINKRIKNDKGLPETINVLPYRLTPQNGDTSIWKIIDNYWQNPVGFREMTPSELPQNNEEKSVLDDILSPYQREIWRVNIEAEKEEQTEKEQFIKETIVSLNQEGKSLIEIQNRIREDFGKELNPVEILEVIK